MTSPVLSRRSFLAGGAALAGLGLAGCTSSATGLVGSTALNAPGVTTTPPAQPLATSVPPDVQAMYGAITDDTYFIRASRMEMVPPIFWRQEVDDPTGEPAGTVIVDTTQRFLYHVGQNGRATRYGVGIGAAGFEWSGRAHIAYKRAWPRWTPPSEMIERHPELEQYRHGMEPGPDNPLGPRALYIHQGTRDTLYRIHGNQDETTIGKAVSSGCVRMLPQDIIHLHDHVRSGAPLLVI